MTVTCSCVTWLVKLGTVTGVSPPECARCWIRSSKTRSTLLAFSDGGYTTNLPVKDVSGGQGRGSPSTMTGSRWLPSTSACCSEPCQPPPP